MFLAALAPVHPTSSNGHHTSGVALVFAGLFFLAVGGLQAFNPRLLWKLNKWQYRHPEANEPSDASYTVQRVVGGIAFVVGIVVIIVAISKI